MTRVYLITNSLVSNNLNFITDCDNERKKEKKVLSTLGEVESKKLCNLNYLKDINVIYTSNYVSSIETAKYLAELLNIDINVTSEIKERILGNIGNLKPFMVLRMQENDFNYRLTAGESLNDVKMRMLKFIKKVLKDDEDKNIAVFTHSIAITSLLTEYCETGFNLENHLILNYKDEAIIDGNFSGINIIELEFAKDKIVNITRKEAF